MLHNQARLSQGRRLPIWITESNRMLGEEELSDPVALWQKRILPYERWLLRGLLPQSDKVDGNLYHDLHARRNTLLPSGADDPDPAYWLLWILRDLRGTRVVADSADPDVVTYATLEEDRVTIVLFNDGDQAKTVPLDVNMPCGYWTGPYVRAIGEGPGGGCERIDVEVTLERDGGKARGSVDLPAYATVSVDFRLDRFAETPRARVRTEHFGDRTLQFITPGTPAALTIETPPAPEGARVFLRVGLLGPAGDEDLVARLNGTDLPLAPIAIQDRPIEAGKLGDANRLEVALTEDAGNPKLALAFASIVVETIG